MTTRNFVIENNKKTLKNSGLILRNIYMPVIGTSATALYSVLCDYSSFKLADTHYDFEELAKLLDISVPDLDLARRKLEAVGLLRVYQHKNALSYIFTINSPLTIDQIKNNKLLYQEIILKIGDSLFERIEFQVSNQKLVKDDYEDVSTRFQDLFNSNIEQDSQLSNTLEIPMVEYKDRDAAFKGLLPTQYIFYLTGFKVSASMLGVITFMKQYHFSNESIKHLIDYSFEVNGKMVGKFIKKIASDFINKNIYSPKQVKYELDNALKSKNIDKTSIKDDLTDESKNNMDLEWEDIFGQMGEL